MSLICDAGPLVALADKADPQREKILSLLGSEPGELILPAPVSAEVDYILGARFGQDARRGFLEDLAVGRYEVACLHPGDYATVAALDDRYADLELGLADCSVVVAAERHATRRILSFDQRHLRQVTPLQGGAFELFPADAA